MDAKVMSLQKYTKMYRVDGGRRPGKEEEEKEEEETRKEKETGY